MMQASNTSGLSDRRFVPVPSVDRQIPRSETTWVDQRVRVVSGPRYHMHVDE